MAATIQQQIQDKRACFRDPDRGYGRKNNIPYLRHPDAHVPLFSVYVNKILKDNLMMEDNETERPPVSVGGIRNGDWVTVTCELKSAGVPESLNDFWAGDI